MFRSIALILLGCLTVSIPVLAQESAAATSARRSVALEVNGIAATVNGAVITKKEVAYLLAPVIAQLNAQFPRRGAEFERQAREAHDKILNELIDRELIMSEYKTQGGKLRPQVADEEIARIKRETFNNDENLFREELRRARMTMDGYREKTMRQLIVQAMRSNKFQDSAPPLPHEIEKEYEEQKLTMRDIRGDKLTFLKIFIPAFDPQNANATPESQLSLAEDLVRQLKEGAKFEELAKKYSRDAMAEQGGKQTDVPRTDLAPEFAALIMDPPTGTIIGPLMDRNGLTIAKVLDKSYGPTPPLSEVRGLVEQRVSSKKTAERYDRWIKHLREKAMISIK